MKMKVFNMRFGSLIMLVISLIMVIQLGEVKGFRNFSVGGDVTWRVPDSNDSSYFDQWASSNRFHVGDSLQFEYKNDSVLVVNKYGYYHCDNSTATSSYNDGNTIIKLEQPGFIYFISGNVDHCRKGQRLIVDVMSPHSSSPAAAPSESHQPQQDNSPATAPTPTPDVAHNSGSPVAQFSGLLGLVATSLFLV